MNSSWGYSPDNNHNFDHLFIDKINKSIVEIIAFIKNPLMVEFIITSNPHRKERYDYPLYAIREIVINMLVDRDYRDRTVVSLRSMMIKLSSIILKVCMVT